MIASDSSDEEEGYTYTRGNRIPCYRFVRSQQQGSTVLGQNPPNQSTLRATASEFCPPIMQEVEETEERKGGHYEQEVVKDEPDLDEEMYDENMGERHELKRSQQSGRPTRKVHIILWASHHIDLAAVVRIPSCPTNHLQ